jgi:hypothetical protein
MATLRPLSRWLRLPGRIALILGLGALPTAVRGDAPEKAGSDVLGGLQVRSEGEKIFLSEEGREAELQLGASPQRERLLRLLREHGPGGVKLDPDPRLIMSGGGGSGFSLRDLQRPLMSEPAPAPRDPPPQTSAPKRDPAPRKKAATDKKD